MNICRHMIGLGSALLISGFAMADGPVLKGTCLEYHNGGNQMRFELTDTRDASTYYRLSRVAFDNLDTRQFGEMRPVRPIQKPNPDTLTYSIGSSQNTIDFPDCVEDMRRCVESFTSFDAGLLLGGTATPENENPDVHVYHCQLDE